MTIRRKIALIFTGLTALILFGSFYLIYYFSSVYIKNAFYERLMDRAFITAQKYLEQDEVSAKAYKAILVKYAQNLPEQKELLVRVDSNKYARDTLIKNFPQFFVDKLLNKEKAICKKDQTYSAGIYYEDNQGNFAIIISAPDIYGTKQLSSLIKLLALIFIFSIIFVYFLGQFYAKQVFNPVSEIIENVNKIRATNLSLRLLQRKGKDELAQLIQTFNLMLERLENSFVTQKSFISNASHELKNPLTAILGEVEVTLSKPRTTEEYLISLNKISSEADRLDILTRNLLNLAQTDFDITDLQTQSIQLDDLLWEVQQHFEKIGNKGQVKIHLANLPEVSERLSIKANANLLKIAISNVVENACKFSGTKEVLIALKITDQQIQISVKDQGVGIPEKDIKNVFQPFFRASNATAYKGFGIGLSLTEKIVKLHKGIIEIISTTSSGTEVRLSFPNN